LMYSVVVNGAVDVEGVKVSETFRSRF